MAADVDVLPVPPTWAGHRSYASRALLRPLTIAALREVVLSGEPVRAVGSRHSFNDLVDSPGALVTLDALELEPELIGEDVVRVSGVTRYGVLAPWLHTRGKALGAMASLPHISIAGAIATGTHGSGDTVGSLASAVVGLELMTASGDVVWLRRGDADFAGAVVALGALGLVLRVELVVEPTYDVAQTVTDDVSFPGALAALDSVWSSATSVSAFTRWDGRAALWRKQRTDVAPPGPDPAVTALGGRPADGPRHPLPGTDPVACTAQLSEPGPWYARLPHFRLEFTPSNGAELQSEYLMPRDRAAEGIEAVTALMVEHRDLILVSEIRSIAADDLWLSGSFGRDTIGLHTTWRQDVPSVMAVLARIEEVLLPFGARPHWGKLFVTDDVAALYPRWREQRDLIARYDPTGVFTGSLLQRVGLRD